MEYYPLGVFKDKGPGAKAAGAKVKETHGSVREKVPAGNVTSGKGR
jgi:hypothetical protein